MMKIDQHDTTAVVVRHNGRFLLIKRATPPEKGLWCFPGGHADEGETIKECAEREAKEEAGEIGVEKEPFYIFTHEPRLFHRHRCHVFFGKVAGKPDPGKEAADIGFFSVEEIKKLELTHFTIQILNHMADKGLLDDES